MAAKIEVEGEELAERGGDVSRSDEERFVTKVNSFLPKSVRVYRVFRVNNKFNARQATMSRTYGYFVPEFALARKDGTVPSLFDFRQALQKFVGSHLFHNFTEKMSPTDPRTRRNIESFTAGEPFEACGRRVIRVEVKGQSFLKHHIRRMVGFAIECVRRDVPASLVELALGGNSICPQHTPLPTAPAEALFLDVATFDMYNRMLAEKKSKAERQAHYKPNSGSLSNGGPAKVDDSNREPVDFVKDPIVRRARELLIYEVIVPAIFSESGAFEAFERWIEKRNEVDFPPEFMAHDVDPALTDAREFLRVVERSRVKRMKDEQSKR